MVRALRSLWKPEPEPFAGRFFQWAPLESNPKPVQRPGVPIVVGGHAPSAARRAARYGDGFFPGRGDPESLRPLIDEMRAECRRIGRNPDEIEVTGANWFADLDAVRRYQDLGVSRVVTIPPGMHPDGLEKGLADFADRVMSRV
jgi:hypothetical protein